MARPTTAGAPPAHLLDNRTGYLLHRAGFLILQRVEQALEPLRLTGRTFFVLAAVRNHALSQQEVSQLFTLDPTTVVTIIDDFEEAGFVTRRRNAADRRRYDLALTPDGEKVLREAMKRTDQVENAFLGTLDDKDRAEFRRMLLSILGDA